MESLVRMVFGTFVRAGIYRGMRHLNIPSVIALAIVGAIVYAIMS